MKMNPHITPEINVAFIAAGCSPMRAGTSEVDYYHSGADLYVRYSPELESKQLPAQSNLTEVVVVIGSENLDPTIGHNSPYEIIRLADLPEFIHFRKSSRECNSHRIARHTYTIALDNFEEAHVKMTRSARALKAAKTRASIAEELFDKARDVQLEATAAFFAHKPPRFRPADQAI